MKNTKIIIFLSSFFLCTIANTPIYAMEQQKEEIQKFATKQPNTSKQKRKHRKKKKHVTQNQTNINESALAKLSITIDNAALRKNIENLKLPQLLQFSASDKKTYLIKLALLANGLLAQEAAIKALEKTFSYSNILKDCAPHTITTSFEFHSPSTTFVIKNFDDNTISRTSILPSNIAKDCLQIKTADAKAALLQTVSFTDLTREKALEVAKQKKYNKYFDSLIDNINPEVKKIGQTTKARIYDLSCSKHVAKIGTKLIIPSLISISLQKTNPFEWRKSQITEEDFEQFCNMVENNNTQKIIEQWFDLFDITSAIKEIMPHWPLLYEHLCQLLKFFSLTSNEHRNICNHAQAHQLHSFITSIIEHFKEIQQSYKLLYSIILAEQNRIIRMFPQAERTNILPIKKIFILADRYGEPLPLSIFEAVPKIYKTTHQDALDNDDDYLTSLSLQQRQKKSVISSKNKKKSRSRPHRKEKALSEEIKKTAINLAQEKEKPETFRMPKYATRILRWFDIGFIEERNPDFRSILYHSFNPLADVFIKKYGIKQERQNQTYPNKMDTVYYMGGEITYPDQSKETMLFVNSYDEKNICYHRGFENHENELFDEFSTNKFSFNFPTLLEEVTYTKKHLEIANDLNNLYEQKTFVENNYCIHLNDNRNNIKITLFKPLQA